MNGRENHFPSVVLVALIISFLSNLLLFQKLYSQHKTALFKHNISKNTAHLYSFFPVGDSSEIIHFSAYNPDTYIFVYVSPDCPLCFQAIDCFRSAHFSFLKARFFFISDIESKTIFDSYCADEPMLYLSKDDIIQFGGITPSVYVTNGQGHILKKLEGFSESEIEEISSAVKRINRTKGPEILNQTKPLQTH